LFIAAHFFYLRLSLNHINFGSPPLRLAFLLASPSPRLAFLLASPSLSLPPPRAAPLWTTPSTGASSGAIAAGVHYSRSLRVIDLINYSFTIQSLPPLSSIVTFLPSFSLSLGLIFWLLSLLKQILTHFFQLFSFVRMKLQVLLSVQMQQINVSFILSPNI
jgi:hypothetical protein